MSTTDPAAGEGPSYEPTRGFAARAAAAHAVERPAPTAPPLTADDSSTAMTTPPTTASAPVTTTPPPAPATSTPAISTPVPSTPAPSAPGPASTVKPPAPPTDVPPPAPVEPVAPRTAGFGGHLGGTFLGLLLGLLAVVVALVGQGRILGVQVDGSQITSWDASVDVLGIVLVTLGALLLAATVWLGLWTPAVPLAAGIVTTVLGALFLFAPGIARTQAMDAFATVNSHDTVTRATVAGTSGTLLLVGLLVLVAGVALGMARRRGRVLGEFRERQRAGVAHAG